MIYEGMISRDIVTSNQLLASAISGTSEVFDRCHWKSKSVSKTEKELSISEININEM